MNLPFTPSFFQELDIFNEIYEYEKDIDKKPIWQVEKVILHWVASKHHGHIGSSFGTGHVKEYVAKQIPKNIDENAAGDAATPQHALDALVTRGFAIFYNPEEAHDQRIIINRKGLIAVRIIYKTDFLKNNDIYQKWNDRWITIFHIGIGLLILQFFWEIVLTV